MHAFKIARAQKVYKSFFKMRRFRINSIKQRWNEYVKNSMGELFSAKPASKAQKEKNKEKLQSLTKLNSEIQSEMIKSFYNMQKVRFRILDLYYLSKQEEVKV